MKNKIFNIIKLACLSGIFLFSNCKERDDYPTFDPPVEEPPIEDIIPPDNQITSVFKKIMDNTMLVKTFLMDTTYIPHAGFEYTHARYVNNTDLRISMHILEIDQSKAPITMQVLSPYNDYLYSTQHIADMIPFNQVGAEGDIIAGINGDVNSSATTGGGYVKSGRVIRQLTGTTANTRPHIGVRKGSSSIEIFNSPNATTYPTTPIDYTQMKHLIGGATWLLYNGDKISTSSSLASRNAVGISEDGQKIYVVSVDGIITNFSQGIILNDLADIMKALGCYKAFQPNTGTQTSLVVKHPGVDKKNDWVRKNILPSYAAPNTGIGFVAKK